VVRLFNGAAKLAISFRWPSNCRWTSAVGVSWTSSRFPMS